MRLSRILRRPRKQARTVALARRFLADQAGLLCRPAHVSLRSTTVAMGNELELVEREPPDPTWPRSDRKGQRAGDSTEGYIHTTSGHFEPGVDRYLPWHRRYPKRQPTACRQSTQVDDFDEAWRTD